jgi:HEPN domain-containing protein
MEAWKTELEAEFRRAQEARRRGNEGQARVCARRAAGIAIREHLRRGGRRLPALGAYDLLQYLKEEPGLPPELAALIDHLTLRVTEEFKLPVDADLVAEARLLCHALVPDWEEET